VTAIEQRVNDCGHRRPLFEGVTTSCAGSFRLEQAKWVGLPVFPGWLRQSQRSLSHSSGIVQSQQSAVLQPPKPDGVEVSAPAAGSGDATAIFTVRDLAASPPSCGVRRAVMVAIGNALSGLRFDSDLIPAPDPAIEPRC
jgi:hypothetical protein